MFLHDDRELFEEIIIATSNQLKIPACLSAKKEIHIPEILSKIISEEIYKSDYEEITTYFQNSPVKYEVAIEALKIIINSNTF